MRQLKSGSSNSKGNDKKVSKRSPRKGLKSSPKRGLKSSPKNSAKLKPSLVCNTKNQPTLHQWFKRPDTELFSVQEKSSTSLLIPDLKKYTSTSKQNSFLSLSKPGCSYKNELKLNSSTKEVRKAVPEYLDISSDTEIIECTPELPRKKEIRLDVTNLSMKSLDDSLEFIPATPHCNTLKSEMKIYSDSLSKPSFEINSTITEPKLSLTTKSSKNITLIFNESLAIHKSLNGKRSADGGTGISPNPKKNSNAYIDDSPFKLGNCKINLTEKIENSINSDFSNVSENEPSFSLLSRGLLLENSSKESDFEEDIKVSKAIEVNDSFEDLLSPNQEINFEIENNEGKPGPVKQQDTDVSKAETVIMNDQFLDELLSVDFDQFSPFKDKKNAHSENSVAAPVRGTSRIVFEDIGKSSYACRENYGRHQVETVERDVYERETKLLLINSANGLRQACILKGFWFESVVREGDIVHILGPDKIGDQLVVSNNKGIVVINPDFLISGTSVVAGVFCQRKAVLNERFKGYEPGNKIMLIGSIVHQLFQESVKMREISEGKLDLLIQEYVYQPNVLKELYAQNLNEEEICEDIKKFKAPIISWIKSYVNAPGKSFVPLPPNNWVGKVLSIDDIEENIWSPKYGIKGKIDLTVTTISGNKTKVLPLELKTGRSSFSAEHKGQVTLYSMMSSDRREDPQGGLLLYLKDGSMCEVPAGEKEKKGLIQLRNELVSFLAATPDMSSNDPKLPPLPDLLDNERVCSRCPQLFTCSALQKVTDSVPVTPHAMANLVPNAIGHLQKHHLEYFRKWCLLLHLEIASSSNSRSIKALWSLDLAKREAAGYCLGDMVLTSDFDASPENNSSHFIHKFVRDQSRNKKLPLIFQEGESVVVSSGKEIAVSMGVICIMNENYVIVALDRDLKSYAKWQRKFFAIDHCEYQNTMSIFFTNLARLMDDTSRTEKLRSLIIDRKVPEFCEGVEADVVSKIRSILKNLNKNQQRAVLRSLLAKDYSILKGFPGTGKTSTIVGLVRILYCLGKSVLITSYTHSAVDNILLKLKEYENIPILRLGKISRIHRDILQFSEEKLMQDMKSVRQIQEFYSNQRVVATTCLGMGHVLFSQKSFDYCVMDEASQVLQAASLGPLFFSERFILVGDALQLPPIVKNHTAKSLGMLESLMEYLDSKEASVCLKLQYRMNEPIMKIANHLIYDGQLMCATEELKTATLSLPLYEEASKNKVPEWIEKCTSSKLCDSVLFVDTLLEAPEIKDSNNQPTNPNEARIIIEMIKWFKTFGVSLNDVGVITPFRAQVKLLRDMSQPLCDALNTVEVNTVDQYQGRDKEVIIYSCVKSGLCQADIKKGEILQDIRRLNVAITRAKVKLIVLGDLATLKYYDPFKRIFEIIDDTQKYEISQGKNDFDWDVI